jgi:hypothetical protein
MGVFNNWLCNDPRLIQIEIRTNNPLKYGGFFRSGFKISQDQQPINTKLSLKPPSNRSPNYEIVEISRSSRSKNPPIPQKSPNKNLNPKDDPIKDLTRE